MLEQAVLDVLVRGHHGFDVLQVIQTLAVGYLVEGTNGNKVNNVAGHWKLQNLKNLGDCQLEG